MVFPFSRTRRRQSSTHLFSITALVLLALLLGACGSSETTTVGSPTRLQSTDVTTIRDEAIKYEKQFAKNGYTGDPLGPSILRIEGSTPIVLSAPHAVKHYRRDRFDPEDADIYTGALAIQLASLTKASALVYARTSKEDPNDDVDGEYKRQLRDLVTQKQARFVLDLHGLAQKQPMQIAVGTGGNRENLLGRTDLLDVLRNTLESAGFEIAEDAPGFAASGANTISSFTRRELGRPALQIEVNKDYRDPRHKPDEYAKLLYALKKAIDEIAEILKKEHLASHILSQQKREVLLYSMVDNSISLCKHPSGWFFRHEAVRTGHLILE